MKRISYFILLFCMLAMSASQQKDPTLEQIVDGIIKKGNIEKLPDQWRPGVQQSINLWNMVYNFLQTIHWEQEYTRYVINLKQSLDNDSERFTRFWQIVASHIFFRQYSSPWKKDSPATIWLKNLVGNLLKPYQEIPDRITPQEFIHIFSSFFYTQALPNLFSTYNYENVFDTSLLENEIEVRNRQMLLKGFIQEYAKHKPWDHYLKDFIEKLPTILPETQIVSVPVVTKVEKKSPETKKRKKIVILKKTTTQTKEEKEEKQKELAEKMQKIQEQPSHVARVKTAIKRHPFLFGGTLIGLTALVSFIIVKKYRAMWK